MEKSVKISSGILGFDKMSNGGYAKNSINLVSGGVGSGKSIFALQFLLAGINAREKVLFVTFEEKKDLFYENALKFGWNLKEFEDSGDFIFLEYSPEKVKMMLDEGGGSIESIILKNKISRVVIDSITSFNLLFEEENEKRQAVLGLFDIIRKWKCTILMTVQQNPSEAKRGGMDLLEFEADSVTLLYFIEDAGERKRYIEILKMRGTDHSKEIRMFNIDNRGIDIGDILVGAPVSKN